MGKSILKSWTWYERKNALHEVYNGLNDEEREVAHALGKAKCKWFRNPANVGYGIGLKRASLGSTTFYPDFIAIKDGRYFFIEPKGAHLLEDTKLSKLLQATWVKLRHLRDRQHG